MSDTLNAAPASLEPELLFNPYNPDRNIVRRCASLTINGVQCKQAALRGQNYCVAHIDRMPRAFENPGHIVIPMLEDHSAIQLTCTKIAHAVANERMKPDAANQILHACKIASFTLPRPARLESSDLSQPRKEASLSVVDEQGTWIAPCEPFLSPSGEMTKYDELDARWTKKTHSENQTELDPAAALTQSYKQVITDLATKNARRKADESAAALAAGRPDPCAQTKPYTPGFCPFATSWCGGPWRDHHCRCCTGKYPVSSDDPSFPGHDVVALVTALRNHIDSQKPVVADHHPDAAAHTPCRVPPISPQLAEVAGHHPNADRETEPNIVLALNAAAEPHRSTRRRIRPSARRRATRHRLQATGCPNVVKFVNDTTNNIPKDEKSVPSQKHNISPQKAKERTPRSIPLLTLDRHRARYFASADSLTR